MVINKKKCHFGFVLFFIIQLAFLLVGLSGTSCYARTTINTDEAEYLINYLFGTEYDNTSIVNLCGNNQSNSKNKSGGLTTAVSDFINYFNANNDLDFNINYTIFFNRNYGTSNNSDSNGAIYYANFNNGKDGSGVYPHLFLMFRAYPGYTNRQYIGIFGADDNKNILANQPLHVIDYSYNGSTITFTNYRSGTMPTDTVTLNYVWRNYYSSWNQANRVDGTSKVQNIPGIVSFSKTNAIYINYDGLNYTSPTTKLLQTFYVAPEPDPEPTPGIGGNGTITNNSGDITGNIDLSGIQGSLNNIDNKIPTSGEIQQILSGETQKITNQISGDTSKIIGALTDDADNLIDNTIITSEDITNSLDFEIATNPYDNFWSTLTNNLKTALLGSKRSIDISFQNRTWTISLDDYLVLPAWLQIILIPISTCLFCWLIVREWKLIFNKLSSGNVDSLLKDNSQERY